MNITGDAKLIASAFVKACGEMNATVAKDAKGNFGKYATLAAIVEATTGALGRNGLAVVQEAHMDESGVCVDTWLVHESGATMQFAPLTMPLTDRKPQAVGSAITYARRYQLAAVCGLAPDDDDGQAAQDAESRTRGAQKPAKAPEPQHRQPPAVEPPTDEEHDILSMWQGPQDAYVWSINNEACENEFEAKNSFKKIVDAHGGKLNTGNRAAIFLAFLRHQMEKLEAMENA